MHDNHTSLADLNDFDVHVPLVARRSDGSEHRRLLGIRVPATGEDAAKLIGHQIGMAVNEGTGFAYWMSEQDPSAKRSASSVKDPANDRWVREIAYGVHLVIDEGGCFVLRFAGHSVTLTNLADVEQAFQSARAMRDLFEQEAHR